MQGTTRGRCKLGSAIATSSTRFATPSWHRIGSRTSGSDQSSYLKRDEFSLNRFGIPKSPDLCFTMLAGKEASMDGETLFDRSSRAGRSGGQDWRHLMPLGGKAVRGEHQHGH